ISRALMGHRRPRRADRGGPEGIAEACARASPGIYRLSVSTTRDVPPSPVDPCVPPVPAVPVRAESAPLVDLRQRLSSANSNLTRTREKLNSVIAESKSRMTRFVREDLPTVALYGGGGAMLGALLGYWLHDQMKGWFGEDSYVGLLGT